MRARAGVLLGGTALVCLAAVAAALITQHVYGMEPCPWCVLQRLIFVVIALVCLIGLAWRSAVGARASAGLSLLLALSGAAAALWQHFVAAASLSCKLTLADRIVSGIGIDGWLPEIFAARASCADAATKLLGVPYEFWSLGLFVLIVLVAARVLARPT